MTWRGDATDRATIEGLFLAGLFALAVLVAIELVGCQRGPVSPPADADAAAPPPPAPGDICITISSTGQIVCSGDPDFDDTARAIARMGCK